MAFVKMSHHLCYIFGLLRRIVLTRSSPTTLIFSIKYINERSSFRKMSGGRQAYNIQQFLDFLNANNLNKVFPLLIYELNLIKSRALLVDEGIQKCRTSLLEIENNSSVDDIVLRLHGYQLDLISKLFMIME